MRSVFLVKFCGNSSNVFFLATRCHIVLHGFQCRYHLKSIGVSYPNWTEKSLGDCIAFVCHNREVLQGFSCQPLFVQMAKIRKFICSDVCPVNENGQQEGQFIRTQKPDKCTGSWLLKDDRRRLRRGLEPKTHIQQEHVFEHYHSLNMGQIIQKPRMKRENQGDNKMRYLHIHRRLSSSVIEGNFSSYGLSGENNTGTVPLIL